MVEPQQSQQVADTSRNVESRRSLNPTLGNLRLPSGRDFDRAGLRAIANTQGENALFDNRTLAGMAKVGGAVALGAVVVNAAKLAAEDAARRKAEEEKRQAEEARTKTEEERKIDAARGNTIGSERLAYDHGRAGLSPKDREAIERLRPDLKAKKQKTPNKDDDQLA